MLFCSPCYKARYQNVTQGLVSVTLANVPAEPPTVHGTDGRFAELCRRPFPSIPVAETGDPIFAGLHLEALGVKPTQRFGLFCLRRVAGCSSPFPTAHLAGVERPHPCLHPPNAAVAVPKTSAARHFLRSHQRARGQGQRAGQLSPPPPNAWRPWPLSGHSWPPAQ